VRPGDLDRSLRFYRDVLGLAVYTTRLPGVRPSGPSWDNSLPRQGLPEVSGNASGTPVRSLMIWIQVRNVPEEHARLATRALTEDSVEMEFLTDDPVAQAVTYQRVTFDARAPRCGGRGFATAGRVNWT